MFENLEDPQKQALLMMAAGLLAPQDRRLGKGGQFAAALSQGMQSGLMGFNNASREKRRAEALAEEARIRKMQADEMQRGQQFNQALSSGYQPAVKPLTPNDDQGFPMPSSPEGFDFSGAMKVDPVKAMQLKQSMTPKRNIAFAPNGKLVDTNDPTLLGQDFAPTPKPEKPKYVKGDIRTVKRGHFEETEQFDGSEWKPIGKAPLWKPDAPEKGPQPPQGYQWGADGKSLTPIPGGPADAKAGKEADAMRKRETGALARADMVLGNVREAIGETGVTTAGPLGAVGRNIPGTGAYNLNKKLDAIRSNIGFAELQAMREASPTGGALGQVAVQELNMLQSVLGSLDTAQSPAQLEKNLYAIEKHYTNWKQAVKGAQREQPGGGFRVLGVE